MKVLIVCSANSGNVSPFILSQANSLKKIGIDIRWFLIRGRGILGYLSNYNLLNREIQKVKPDIVHAHYGFSGLLASLQRKVPVVVTFHGCDINAASNLKYSILTSLLSHSSIFVNENLLKKMWIHPKRYHIIPCGVDIDVFKPNQKVSNASLLKIVVDEQINIVFSSSFDIPIKNYSLAKNSIERAQNKINLIELKEYSPMEVCNIINMSDFLLLTSLSESSPVIVKEAMACNKPIVSTDVGDVKFLFNNLPGYFIVGNNQEEVVDAINKVVRYIESGNNQNGRNRIIELGLDIETISYKIVKVYTQVINN